MAVDEKVWPVFENRTVILGAGGSIAAYKLPSIVSLLVKSGAQVHCALTRGAEKFVTREALRTMSRHQVWLDSFDEAPEGMIPHIDLAERAELLLIAPASAGLIARLAHGLADDMLCCLALAACCPKMIVPAMNVHMYENSATQANLALLQARGWSVMEPAEGLLACGYVGRGKMPEVDELLDWAATGLASAERGGRRGAFVKCQHPQDMLGQNIVITAGPTQEKIDPVRYITNHSSGKMGYALAEAAHARGAKVQLISGPVALAAPAGLSLTRLRSAEEMAEAVLAALPTCDALIMAAAVADFTPAHPLDHKIKKEAGEMTAGGERLLPLKRTRDILGEVALGRRPEQLICGFAMETEDLEANAREKLTHKRLDLICANLLNETGAGFAHDTNVLTLIGADFCEKLPLMSKREAADRILDKLNALRAARQAAQNETEV